MLYSKVRSRTVINGKEGFRFKSYFCLRICQNFEIQVSLLIRGRRNISRQFLLINSKVICQWSPYVLLYPKYRSHVAYGNC